MTEEEKSGLKETEGDELAEIPLEKPKRFRQTWWRWITLTLACFAMVGSEFSYDIPQALITEMKDMYELNEAQFTLLYTVYSIPNVVITLAGGFFIDKLGIRLGIAVFLSLTTTGQALFAISAMANSYALAIVSRVVFGCGSENLNVAQSAIVCKWFKGKELAFALGINVSAARLGSVVNDYLEPWLCHQAGSKQSGVSVGLWFGFALCAFSLCCGLVVGWLDSYADKRDLESGAVTISFIIYLIQGLEDLDEIHLKDIWSFKTKYWLVSIVCVGVYMAMYPFTAVASGFFQKRYDFNSNTAGRMIGTIYMVSAPLTPFTGLLVDYVGMRTIFMCISSTSFLAAHLYLGFMDCHQCYWGIVGLVLIGLGHCLFSSSIWPCIPHVVEDHTIGTAFGLTTALQNIGLALGPYLIGVIKDATESYKYGYFWVSMFLSVIALTGILFSIILMLYDFLTDSVLHKKEGKNFKKLQEMRDKEQAMRRRRSESRSFIGQMR